MSWSTEAGLFVPTRISMKKKYLGRHLQQSEFSITVTWILRLGHADREALRSVHHRKDAEAKHVGFLGGHWDLAEILDDRFFGKLVSAGLKNQPRTTSRCSRIFES